MTYTDDFKTRKVAGIPNILYPGFSSEVGSNLFLGLLKDETCQIWLTQTQSTQQKKEHQCCRINFPHEKTMQEKHLSLIFFGVFFLRVARFWSNF